MGGELSRMPQPTQESPYRPQFQQSKSLDFGLSNPPRILIEESTDNEATKTNNQHFTDFSLFPDRFSSDLSTRSSQLGIQQQTPSDPFHQSPGASGGLSPGVISKYNFRVRSFSNGGQDFPERRRPRSNSLSSSYYYFDFSCIPEKDPRCSRDDAIKRRIRNSSQGEEDYDHPSGEFANSNSPKAPPPAKTMKAANRRKSEQYSFFDYSMIPDKMGPVSRQNSQNATNTKQEGAISI